MKFENVPETLKKTGLWCVWKGGRGKVPYSPVTGSMAKSNDPSTFSDFQSACQFCIHGGYDGLGIGIFNNIGAIDIDHCITDGQYSDMATDIVEHMGSYTEISPSGNGIRIIFTVNEVQYDTDRYYINNQRKGLEVYIAGVTKKFVTITGNKINDNPVVNGAEKLPVILDKYMLSAQTFCTMISFRLLSGVRRKVRFQGIGIVPHKDFRFLIWMLGQRDVQSFQLLYLLQQEKNVPPCEFCPVGT